MAENILVNGKMEEGLAREQQIMQMDLFMLGNGKMGKGMGKEKQ